jgi:DNA-binding CsgD family transcriptional regulator
MDRDLLKRYLSGGLSLEQIGVLADLDRSTVGYWARKHGLTPNGRDKHAARGGLTRDQIEPLIEAGRTQKEIAEALNVSQSTLRYWLGRYQLRTQRRHRVRPEDQLPRLTRTCAIHGRTTFYRRSDTGYRCVRCNNDAVSKRRRTVKRILVEEAGGACRVCGYDRCMASLHFHHRKPIEKSFALSGHGYSRSLASLREEARKCVLLCSNCHYEVEEGIAELS